LGRAVWVPEPSFAATSVAVDSTDAVGRRLAIVAVNVVPGASGAVALGRLEFMVSSSDVALSDLPISYEDVAVDGASIASVREPERPSAASSRVTALHPCSPNPFNPRTTIRYTLDREDLARLVIYDVAGRRVRTLVDAVQPAGERAVVWDGRDESGQQLSSGIYVYQLATSTYAEARKVVLAK
jgi:hypothetical protein